MKRADYAHLLKRNNSLLARYQGNFIAKTQKREASAGLEHSTKLARLDAVMTRIVDATIDAIITVSPLGKIETANSGAAMTFGYSQDRIKQLRIQDLLPNFQRFIDTKDERYIVGKGHFEAVGRNSSGHDFLADLVIAETRVGNDQLYVIVLRDITEFREQQQKLEHQALHDSLTGLPNRLLLSNRIEHALANSNRSGKAVALFLMDLDRFKEVNDTLGHHIGDALLKDIAQRLPQVVRPTDTVARLGGDEFAILLPEVDHINQAVELADRILAVFEGYFRLEDGIMLDVGSSIGIALYPEHADERAKLMQCADVAMYRAKAGSQKAVVYDQTQDKNSVRQLTMSSELRQAIREKTLTMEFQPQLDLRTNKILSVEGLARWRHPTLGYVPPDEFVAHAEQGGLIEDLTRWTMETALSQFSQWESHGLNITISVNLSTKMLVGSSLIDILQSLIRQTRVNPERIMIEITESALTSDPELARITTFKLSDLGVRLSVDDYGTGYSSLAYLQKFPLDEIKIDKSFVFGMLETHNDGVIVRSTVELAHNLGLEVVAEGVEIPAQLEALAQLDCDKVQGFGISPALNAEAFVAWLKNTNFFALRHAA